MGSAWGPGGKARPQDAGRVTLTSGGPPHRGAAGCEGLSGFYSSVALPPAAASLSLALPENLFAVTFSATEISPSPSTLTS